jgi:hypothetical protein
VFTGGENGCWCVCRQHKTKWFIEPDISYRASQYAKGLVRALPEMPLAGYEQVEPVSLEPL